VEKKMSIVFIALMGLALAAVFALVVLNRASAAVVNAAVPVAFGAISAIGLVFAFARPEPIARAFPIVFVVERASLLPVVIPDRPFPFMSLGLADQMRQIDPTTFEPPPKQEGFDFIVPLYHEYLQKIVVDSIAAKHSGTWRMRTERFHGFEQWSPTPDAAGYSSKVISAEQLIGALGKNRFARVQSGFGKLALPPGTQFEIEAPHHNPQSGETGTIHLKNRFCDIEIRTVQSWSSVGLGNYTMLLGIPLEEAQQKYWTIQYVTRINASFRWYLIGHPDMAVHRQWANSIVEELAHAFDEDGLWRRTTENYMLRQHLPPAVKGMGMPLGPIRFTAPPAAPPNK